MKCQNPHAMQPWHGHGKSPLLVGCPEQKQMYFYQCCEDFCENAQKGLSRKPLPVYIRPVALGIDFDEYWNGIRSNGWDEKFTEFIDIEVAQPHSAISKINSLFPLIQYLQEQGNEITTKYQQVIQLYNSLPGSLSNAMLLLDETETIIKSMSYNGKKLYTDWNTDWKTEERGTSFVVRLMDTPRMYDEFFCSYEWFTISSEFAYSQMIFYTNSRLRELYNLNNFANPQIQEEINQLFIEVLTSFIGDLTWQAGAFRNLFEYYLQFFDRMLQTTSDCEEWNVYCESCTNILDRIREIKVQMKNAPDEDIINRESMQCELSTLCTLGLNTLIQMYNNNTTFNRIA